jgi:hypothetical protein
MNDDRERAAEERRQLGRAAAQTSADWVVAALSYGAGILLALLPRRYRRWIEERGGGHLTAAAVASGLLQFLGCLVAFILRFFLFRQQRMEQWMTETLGKGGLDLAASTAGQYAMGFTTTFEYLLQPLTVVLIYFTLEGVVRMLAGMITGEVVGTLPLQAVAWLHGQAEARWAEWKLGPRIVDLVQTGDGSRYHLRILSCRPKQTWDRMMTIVYDGVFYELAGEERGPFPRQFIYLLRRIPEGKVIRGHHYYRPDEPLAEK